MTGISGSGAIFQVLYDWGIDHIYGFPGGSFDSIMNAIHNWRNKIKFIEVRHEEVGALAASAKHKISGKVGVRFNFADPGAVHLMNGLYDVKYDKIPTVAIVANVSTSRQDIDFFQASDEKPWSDPVAVWNHQAKTAESIPVLMDEAIHQAYQRKGPAVLILPKDFGWDKTEDNFRNNTTAHKVVPNFPAPRKEQVSKALELTKNAENPTVYFGHGAEDASAELKEFSDKLKMPLASSVLGKGIVGDEFPTYMGLIGRVGAKPSNDIQTHADLVVRVGDNSPFSVFFFNPEAKVIQIDISSERLGKRHVVTVPTLADAKKTLCALTEVGESRSESPLYKAAPADRENWEVRPESLNDSDEIPTRVEPIFDVTNKKAAGDAVFTIDVGNVNINFDRLMHLHGDQKWIISDFYATVGYGAPASLAAATIYPNREVWNPAGDGGFAMMNQELLIQARCNMHVINVVPTNEALGYIEAERVDESHQPLSGVKLLDNDWAMSAEDMNVKGFTVRNKKESEDVVIAAQKMEGSVLIDCKITHGTLYSIELNTLDDPAFVAKYDVQALKLFNYFAGKYGVEVDAASGASEYTEAEPVEAEEDAPSGASRH